MNDPDLAVFYQEWMRVRDGRTGIRYVNALCAADRPNDALAVCDELWDDGYVVGRTEAAWIEHGRGEYSHALALMTEVLPVLEDEERLYAVGVVGCWRWHFFNDAGAEAQLREGMRHYDSAWADLGHLLIATDRVDEGHRTLVDGVEAGNLMCMLPLAVRLARQGDLVAAEQLYRRAFELGDAYSAWNLSLLFEREGRREEAANWLWKAARAGDEDAIRALAEDAENDDDDQVV